jgi:hypothetical protein
VCRHGRHRRLLAAQQGSATDAREALQHATVSARAPLASTLGVMTERAEKWQPVPDLDSPFGSISYSYSHDILSVRIREAQTFPLLVVEESQWLGQFIGAYEGRSHFALISSDDLVQLLAKPNVLARWEE